ICGSTGSESCLAGMKSDKAPLESIRMFKEGQELMKLKCVLPLLVLMLLDSNVSGENGELLLISSDEFSESAVSLPLPGDIDPSLTTFVPASSVGRIFSQ